MIKAEVGQVFEEESVSVWARSHGAFPRSCLQGSPACILPSSRYGFKTFESQSLALCSFPPHLKIPEVMSGLNLHRSWTQCHSLCKLMCTCSVVSGKRYCLKTTHYLWFLQSFRPLWHGSLALSEGREKDIPFRAEHSKVFHSLPFVQLWVSVVIITARKSFSDEGWRTYWSMCIEIHH